MAPGVSSPSPSCSSVVEICPASSSSTHSQCPPLQLRCHVFTTLLSWAHSLPSPLGRPHGLRWGRLGVDKALFSDVPFLTGLGKLTIWFHSRVKLESPHGGCAGWGPLSFRCWPEEYVWTVSTQFASQKGFSGDKRMQNDEAWSQTFSPSPRNAVCGQPTNHLSLGSLSAKWEQC